MDAQQNTSVGAAPENVASSPQQGRHNESARTFSPRERFASSNNKDAAPDEDANANGEGKTTEVPIGRPVSEEVYERLKQAAEIDPPGPSRDAASVV